MNIPESQRSLYIKLAKVKERLSAAILGNDQGAIVKWSKEHEAITEKIANDNARRRWK